jgi:LL-diaminopimelate aminotransferase
LLDFGWASRTTCVSGVVETSARGGGGGRTGATPTTGFSSRRAAARYLARVVGAPGIDPESEVIHSIGAKPALAMLPAAFINPGDVALVTVPGYPVLATHTRWYGGRVAELPLTQERGYLPDLSAIKAADLKRAKLLYLNYPNNPTGASATREFYEEVVRFAKRRKLIVVVDAAYAALTYGGPPFSFLSIPGAKDVAELHSLQGVQHDRLASRFRRRNPLIVAAFAWSRTIATSSSWPSSARVYALSTRDHRRDRPKHERCLRRMTEGARRRRLRRRCRAACSFYTRAPKAMAGGRKFKTAGGLRVPDHR